MNFRRQPIATRTTRRLLPFLLLPVLLVAGCDLSTSPTTPTASTGLALQGRVRGGQQPVVGAHVYLFAANTTANGGPGIAASSSNASLSLLNSSSTGHSDSVGAYVLTDSTGSFSITGDYTCTSGQQVYLYALGGNPGAGTNSSSGFLAALGNCPVAGNFAGTVPFIWMNEITTVAAAYAFAGYATDATHVSSSGTALALTGIANAFATAANLANIATGVALTTTPAGNGTAPATTVITLANILASCVNSADITGSSPSPSAACSNLFGGLSSNGASGSVAGDTATEAIYIAHNPTYNVSTLYGLPGSNLAFGTGLTSAPNNFSLILSYTNGLTAGNHLAIDASGNIWVGDGAANKINEFGPTGAALAPSGGYSSTVGGPAYLAVNAAGNLWVYSAPTVSPSLVFFNTSSQTSGVSTALPAYSSGIAIDPSGNLWVPTSSGTSNLLGEYNSSGTNLASLSTGSLNAPVGPAVDGSGNIYVPNTNGTLSKFSGGAAVTGSPFSAFTGYTPKWGALDPSNNIWTFNSNCSLSEATSAGTAVTGSPFNNGVSGSPTAFRMAIDSLGQVWADCTVVITSPSFSINYFLYGVSSTGASLTGSNGLIIPAIGDVAIDGAGNLWIAATTKIVEVIGLASPVVTPIVANLLSPYTHPASRP
jgi:hypothetical protein